MKREKLQDAIGMVGDDLIKEASDHKIKKKFRWIPAVAILLCISVLAGTAALHFGRGGINKESHMEPGIQEVGPQLQENADENGDENGDDAEDIVYEHFTDSTGKNENYYSLDYCLTRAVYPERVLNYNLTSDLNDQSSYENWREDRNSFRADYDALSPDLGKFIASSTKTFLSETEGNAIYSPVNVYMALAMLAQTSGGESRAQILKALGSDSIEAVRKDANAIWQALYTDDGASKTILANSLWLRDDGEYNEKTLDILSDSYYASAFEGRMGSKEYDDVLRGWLNEQTDGMLSDQVKGVGMPEDTVLALASTLLFNAKWSDEFNPERNTTGIFNSATGKVSTEFMNESRSGNVAIGDNFAAYTKYFAESGHMTFILPKEGMTPQELIATDEFAEFVLCGGRDSYMAEYTDKPCWDSYRHAIVNFSMPKFDISSQLDLTKDIHKLGITDITDETRADMSPITEERTYLNSMLHGARVTVDEKGCKAASFTLMLCGATAAPLDEIDFVLDRPFVFVINGYDGLPLFIGTVNNI